MIVVDRGVLEGISRFVRHLVGAAAGGNPCILPQRVQQRRLDSLWGPRIDSRRATPGLDCWFDKSIPWRGAIGPRMSRRSARRHLVASGTLLRLRWRSSAIRAAAVRTAAAAMEVASSPFLMLIHGSVLSEKLPPFGRMNDAMRACPMVGYQRGRVHVQANGAHPISGRMEQQAFERPQETPCGSSGRPNDQRSARWNPKFSCDHVVAYQFDLSRIRDTRPRSCPCEERESR